MVCCVGKIMKEPVGLMRRRRGGGEADADQSAPSGSNVVGVLSALAEVAGCEISLCKAVDHSRTAIRDIAWGCGYRNALIVISSIDETLLVSEKRPADVAAVQSLIEDAWAAGYDTEGADQLKWRLVGKRKWIGTTEVYAALTFLGIDVRIQQFNGPGEVASMIELCKTHFAARGRDSAPSPLYFQRTKHYISVHVFARTATDANADQGHSRTVIGFMQRSEDTDALLVLDPGRALPVDFKKLMKCGETDLEARVRSLGPDKAMRLIEAFTVRVDALKKSEYQLLQICYESSPLSDEQRISRKRIPGT